jgi:hypothetical protein
LQDQDLRQVKFSHRQEQVVKSRGTGKGYEAGQAEKIFEEEINSDENAAGEEVGASEKHRRLVGMVKEGIENNEGENKRTADNDLPSDEGPGDFPEGDPGEGKNDEGDKRGDPVFGNGDDIYGKRDGEEEFGSGIEAMHDRIFPCVPIYKSVMHG